MPVPQGKMYLDTNLGLGHIADTSIQQVFTEPASETIIFGAPLAYTDDQQAVKVAGATDKVIGIARALEGLKDDFGGFGMVETAGHFLKDEPVSVLTTGSIVVAVSTDVEKGQQAVVSTDGTFAVYTADTDEPSTEATGTPVGVFRTSGVAGNTAVLHVNL